MNDLDQSFHELQLAEPPAFRGRWLGAFETALTSRDAAKIGALFHDDCHWRDVLAFTWHFTAVEGREKSLRGSRRNKCIRRRTDFICRSAEAASPGASPGHRLHRGNLRIRDRVGARRRHHSPFTDAGVATT